MNVSTTAGDGQHGPIASISIIGMACRLPGAGTADEFWELLAAGGCAIRPIPADRWDAGRLHHPERNTPGCTVNRQAGLIDAIDAFDAAFFGMSSREARALDPQQRLLLEETWHALEDAGLAAEALHGQRVGVYAAAMANDYMQHAASPFRAPDAYSAIGVYAALLANRLSAFFGWRGESATIDTACASSLAALHQARLALLGGTVDYCIVAAANALLSPWKAVSFSQAGMLSGEGLCKTFAEDADGYVPGEGAVVLILRRTRDALAAGDRIHGLLLGTAINHMGPGSGITAPSAEAEAQVIRDALGQAGVDPCRLSYVECHGTGTALGDPIEVEALARALASERTAGGEPQALLGSVKTNIGHLEAAAGLAGVAKLLLMLRHGMIPPSINLTQDNPLIEFDALPFEPARRLVPWLSRPRLAGVSAFGFGGAGAHAIFAEPPPIQPVVGNAKSRFGLGRPVLLALSAADETALRLLASQLALRLQQADAPDLAAWGRALSLGRGSLKHRALIKAVHPDQAAAALRSPDLPVRCKGDVSPTLALRLLDGSDSAAWRMLRGDLPGLDRLACALEKRLRAAGFDAASIEYTEYVQMRSFIELLRQCGLNPSSVQAFGQARPPALAVAGVLGDEAAVRLACHGDLRQHELQRPDFTYRDGDTGLTLVPSNPSPSALARLLPNPQSTAELLVLGRKLWRSNYTFRAHFDEWQQLLGGEPSERLAREPADVAVGLAVASALWATCARWSLRPPSAAIRWPAWPLAGMAGDGLIGRKLALDVLAGVRPLTELADALAQIPRSPEAGRHPWLEQQRGHLPELDGLDSPLSGMKIVPSGEFADFVVAIGPQSLAQTVLPATGQLLSLDPETGLDGLESVLAELWYAGLAVQHRALGLPRPHLNLPLYPFTRKSYWLPRLPEDATPVLWETGQVLGKPECDDDSPSLVKAGPPLPASMPEPANAEIESRDWVECVRLCVAETLEADASEIDLNKPLDIQGIDSLISMDLAVRIERSAGVKLSPAVLEELGNVMAIAGRVATEADNANPVKLATEAGRNKPAPTSVSSPQTNLKSAALAGGVKLVSGAHTQAEAGAVRIGIPGLLDTVSVSAHTLPVLGAGQVLVRVRAAGLNFRDLMIALDALPEARGEPLGLEFCGIIENLGASVKALAVGQRVFGIASGALADWVVAESSLVAPAPDSLDNAACAALPIAYLTALRCLETLQPGQSVLIHAAAGGLGQAALRLAMAVGARVYATAGSAEKRAWLEAMGIERAMDSRKLDFADEILSATGGRGVDWVLNSLTGAAIDRGFDCLAQGGVFVEVGKTDIRNPNAIALRHPGIDYRVYDLVAEFRQQPERIGRLLYALANRVESGELGALPVETFPWSEARAAFQHMARARHRGKIVLLSEECRKLRRFESAAVNHGTDLPLAVLGLSGRFPGADDSEALWELLEAGRCAIGEVPAGRWSAREIESFGTELPNPALLMRGGFLSDVESFDPAFFGFSPREARATDPRQRLLLEETWKALQAAGLSWDGLGSSLREAHIGFFVAADTGDYGFKRAMAGAKGDPLALAGNLASSLAARLAYVFDCDGPALTLDLACSSSLGALWAAQQALLRGDCRYAVAAAVSLHSTPLLAAQLGAANLLSATGRCLPFTLESDGFVPAEACVALVLTRLDQAEAGGNAVQAVIRGISVGHDGHGRSFTLPSVASLASLQTSALERAGLSAGQIDLVSAHGIGTQGGDSTEIAALARTFDGRAEPLPVTTLKPQLGHTLAAAGLSAVVHAIAQIQHNRLLPVGLAGRELIPDWDTARFYLPASASPWPAHADGRPRRVLVNTFAINGGQGAAIVEEAPAELVRFAPILSPTHTLRRRRFWLETETSGSESGSLPASLGLISRTPATTLDSIPKSAESLEGLRTELAELLQEPPDSLDLNVSPAALGLSSVLGIELQHRLRRRFGIVLSLSELLGAERLADIAPLLKLATGFAPVRQVNDDDAPFEPFPLTDLQAAYWSGRQPGVPLGGVDCQVYWEFECAKKWLVADLETAWNRLVEIHPMLRAVVDGNAQQRVLPDVPRYRFETLGLRGLAPEIASERRQTLREAMSSFEIDPSVWPLFRIAASFTGDSLRLHCVLNLLVMDVLSLYTLLDQLALLASNPTALVPMPAMSFRQCVYALRDAADSEEWREAERFWAQRGPSLPPAPELPMTKPLESIGRLSTRRFQARLSAAQWRAISEAAKSHGLSPSVALLSVFAGTLAHWTASPRFTLNLTTHTRPPIHADINKIVGNFTGTVLLDVDVQAGLPLRELAARTGKRLLEHLNHAVYPGVQVLRRRAAALGWGSGLMPVVFTSMLGYESLRQGGKEGAATQIGALIHGATRTPQVTLDAQVQTDSEGLLLSWDVAEGVFADGLPETLFAAWAEAASALATSEGWELELPAHIAEREAMARGIANSDVGPVPEEALFAPFLRQAAANPQRIAIIEPDRTLSYGELAGICADFAERLRTAGVQSEELVAVAMEKGWRQVMAAIAVQMAGAAYLPLAPELPAARFAQLIVRGGVRFGLTEAGRELAWPEGVDVITVSGDALPSAYPSAVELSQTLSPPTGFAPISPQSGEGNENPLSLDGQWVGERGFAVLQEGSGLNSTAMSASPLLLPDIGPDSLAYVIFTSGSTGEPKGVMLTHRAALNTCLDINRRFGIGPQDRVLGLSALSFDLSVWDIFGMFAAGGALVLPKPASASDPAYLADCVREHRVTVWNSVPMYLELFLAGEPSLEAVGSLRIAMLSGDWIAPGLAGRLRGAAPQARVHSLGGATEAAIWSIHYPIGDSPRPGWNSVPYGRALDNQAMQVLDAELEPCADGVTGDLYIGGVGLALGYWRDPERTAAAFITHPKSGERLYRTGDLARWREDGLIEFMGRRDGQVKIDGFRVELGEIEAVLRSHAAVREAVAVAPSCGQGRKRLAAFCLVETETAVEALLSHLRERLPAYMLPKELRILDRLPLTDNEKVDRRALAEWAFRAEPVTPASHGGDANALKWRLLTLWAEVLGDAHKLPDTNRNLFELGADSLMAVIASRRISTELGIPCTVTEIFEHATIARLALALANRAPLAAVPVSAPPAAGPSRADMRRSFRSRLD